MRASDPPASLAGRFGPHVGRAALVAMLAVALGGCPTPIPGYDAKRDYLPSIAVREPGAEAESLVIGRLLLEGSGSNPVSIELARLDDDTVVARRDLPLAPDGRFTWGLDRGTYVIARVDRFSDYAKGQYQVKASFYPHLRFEAKGTRYVGQARAVLDPSKDDILFAMGAQRQEKLGVRSLVVSDELARERNEPSASAALKDARIETLLMYPKPVEVYPVRTKEGCTRWKYWRLCFLPWVCT